MGNPAMVMYSTIKGALAMWVDDLCPPRSAPQKPRRHVGGGMSVQAGDKVAILTEDASATMIRTAGTRAACGARGVETALLIVAVASLWKWKMSGEFILLLFC